MGFFLWDVLSPLTARNGSAHSLYLLLHTLVETIADSFTLGSVLLSPLGPSPRPTTCPEERSSGMVVTALDTAQQCSDHMEIKRTDTTEREGGREKWSGAFRNRNKGVPTLNGFKSTRGRAEGGHTRSTCARVTAKLENVSKILHIAISALVDRNNCEGADNFSSSILFSVYRKTMEDKFNW